VCIIRDCPLRASLNFQTLKWSNFQISDPVKNQASSFTNTPNYPLIIQKKSFESFWEGKKKLGNTKMENANDSICRSFSEHLLEYETFLLAHVFADIMFI
jgi:hypothetical protein